MRVLVSVLCAFAIGSALAGCKDTKACEQSRMEMAKIWRQVKDTAGARALPGPSEEVSEAKKAERKRVWGDIQEQAYLVEGSFQTEQITWSAADHGRGELLSIYRERVPNKEDPLVTGFGRMVDEANTQYDAFQQKCR